MTEKCDKAILSELQYEWITLQEAMKALFILHSRRADEVEEKPKCIDFTNIQNIVNQMLE